MTWEEVMKAFYFNNLKIVLFEEQIPFSPPQKYAKKCPNMGVSSCDKKMNLTYFLKRATPIYQVELSCVMFGRIKKTLFEFMHVPSYVVRICWCVNLELSFLSLHSASLSLSLSLSSRSFS